MPSFAIRAIAYKGRPNLLNRGSPIWLNLIYVVEGGVLRILAQTILKNVESFGFYEGFPKTTPKSSFLPEWFS
jgi:hypothetical protein